MSLSRYEILWRGDLPPDPIRLIPDHSDAAQLSPELRQQISILCQQRRECGQKVENLPLYRCLDWKTDGQGLSLHLATTQYEDYLGLGILKHPQAPWVLAVAATTEIDGRLVLERRSSAVAQGSGLFHVKPSGHIHPPETPWEALQKENWEELALQPHEISSTRLRGLVRSHTSNCLCLIFHQTAQLSWQDWSQRTPPDAWEAESLFGLPAQLDPVRNWLKQSSQLATGPCLAALELYLQYESVR